MGDENCQNDRYTGRRPQNETTYYLIFDILEGKISDGFQLYGVEALECGYNSNTFRSDTHFTNSSPNYRKWRSLFFERLKPLEDSDYLESSMQDILLELFANKRGVDFFEGKYRINNIRA